MTKYIGYISWIFLIVFASFLLSQAPVNAQSDFCPGSVMMDASASCLECAQTKTCNQDERCMRAQCCLCRCYPQCCSWLPDTDCSRYSCSCDDGGSLPPDDGEGDVTFIVLIGTLLIGGGIGAAILKARNKPPASEKKGIPEKKEDKKDKKAVRYVLQLSKDTLQVSDDTPDSFTVTVWKLLETGEYIPQPGAPIQISYPSVGLLVRPQTGMGTLKTTVSLSKPVSVSSVDLTISASAGGMTQKATVHVTIEQSLQVGFE